MHRDLGVRKAYQKSVRHKYKETTKRCQKAWVGENREHLRTYQREWYKKNRARPHGLPGSKRYEARLMGYKSGFERTFAANLSARGIGFKYESIKLPYRLERTYSPDYYIVDHDFYIETKGLLDRDSKAKMVAVKQQHPDVDIRFVFMHPHKKIPGTKQTHAQWAERNGFLWAESVAPQEWFNE
jgi:restriction endonuclease